MATARIAGGVGTGRALVRGGCDKVVFIGSTTVGRAVMRDAADSLTPLTLELGGKDPFVVLGDADVADVVPTAMRAAFQSCGQNCVAAERFLVHDCIYDDFLRRCSAVASDLRQGRPLGTLPQRRHSLWRPKNAVLSDSSSVVLPRIATREAAGISVVQLGAGDAQIDCGALCMPGLREKVHALVEDARKRGARVLVGGVMPDGQGQFYPPTIVADVTPDMQLFREETFGPVMAVTRFSSDEQAVRHSGTRTP